MTTFEIDISRNERQGFSALGAIAYLFIAFFAGTGLFITYKTFQNNGEWVNYLTAICPLMMSLIIYLQLTGKAPYKKYFQVDAEKVEYRAIPFSKTVIHWTQVNSVECDYSRIVFRLSNRTSKTFPLTNVKISQIRELKEVLRAICMIQQKDFTIK